MRNWRQFWPTNIPPDWWKGFAVGLAVGLVWTVIKYH